MGNTNETAEPTGASGGSVCDRITAYLVSGGLFNPEQAIHERVRDLLIDCRDEIEQLSASIKWHKETLIEAEEVMCRKNLTDAERNAIEHGIASLESDDDVFQWGPTPYAATLRALLERTK